MTIITQNISDLGPVPDIADPTTFEARMNTLITSGLPQRATEENAWAAQANAMAGELAALSAISALLVGGTGSVAAVRAALNLPLRGYIAGLTLSTGGGSATFAVAAGECADSTATYLLQRAASISKSTGAWAVGTAGALDTGTIANNTWYHAHLIRRPDTGVVDVLVSLSVTAPTLPANYTQFRRIGSMKTNGSAQWTKFVQDGDFFQWDVGVLDANVTSAGSAAVTRTLTVPTGVSVLAQVQVGVGSSVGPEYALLTDPATADIGAGLANSNVACAINTNAIVQSVVRTNSSAQIRSRVNSGTVSDALRITTQGWFDSRGRNA